MVKPIASLQPGGCAERSSCRRRSARHLDRQPHAIHERGPDGRYSASPARRPASISGVAAPNCRNQKPRRSGRTHTSAASAVPDASRNQRAWKERSVVDISPSCCRSRCSGSSSPRRLARPRRCASGSTESGSRGGMGCAAITTSAPSARARSTGTGFTMAPSTSVRPARSRPLRLRCRPPATACASARPGVWWRSSRRARAGASAPCSSRPRAGAPRPRARARRPAAGPARFRQV